MRFIGAHSSRAAWTVADASLVRYCTSTKPALNKSTIDQENGGIGLTYTASPAVDMTNWAVCSYRRLPIRF